MALFNRKDKKDKNKSGENIIGKIIYMFLLFAPLLSILTSCMYVTFNKNAYQSYSASLQLKLVEDNDINNFTEQSTYFIFTNGATLPDNAPQSVLIKFDNWISNMSKPNSATYFTLGYSRQHTITYSITFYDINKNYISNREIATGDNYNNINETSFRYLGYETLSGNANATVISTLEIKQLIKYIDGDTLDNAFEYGTHKVEESNLYNWSKTTAMYTVMQTTTTQLGITNTFTPMLLTYWLIISVIYFIYDIALMLIWILHRKIHELTESV